MAIYYITDFHGLKVSRLQSVADDKMFGCYSGFYSEDEEKIQWSKDTDYNITSGLLRQYAEDNDLIHEHVFDRKIVSDQELAAYFLNTGKTKVLLYTHKKGKYDHETKLELS